MELPLHRPTLRNPPRNLSFTLRPPLLHRLDLLQVPPSHLLPNGLHPHHTQHLQRIKSQFKKLACTPGYGGNTLRCPNAHSRSFFKIVAITLDAQQPCISRGGVFDNLLFSWLLLESRIPICVRKRRECHASIQQPMVNRPQFLHGVSPTPNQETACPKLQSIPPRSTARDILRQLWPEHKAARRGA